MTKKRAVLAAALGVAAVLVILAAANRKLLFVIWHNLYSPSVKLDDSAGWDGGASYEGLVYSEVSESDYLNLYVPEGAEAAPLLILVHGGGFVANDCESRQAQFMYRYFRDHGYACASVNYRLAQEAAYPAAIEDVKAAVRFLRANAEKFGYDAGRFAIWGESAGGYLAAMAAVTSDQEYAGVEFTGERDLAEPVSGQVSALVDYYGIIDFDLARQDFRSEGIPGWLLCIAQIPLNRDLEGYDTVEDMWIRKDVDACTDEELDRLSARAYIGRNLTEDSGLKTLIYHGNADITVSSAQSARLAEAFTDALGADSAEFELFSGYKHADDRFYTNGQMEEVRKFLDSALNY